MAQCAHIPTFSPTPWKVSECGVFSSLCFFASLDWICTEAATGVVLQNRCSQRFRKNHMKTPALKSLFAKVPGLKTCNFVRKRLQHRLFLVNIPKFLRTPFFIKHLQWLFQSTSFREIYRVSLCIQFKYWNVRTRKNCISRYFTR